MGTQKKQSKGGNKHILQPAIGEEYNKGMGVVDLHDNAIANYRINTRGKKYYWTLIKNGFSQIMVNSWKLYQKVNKSNISQLNFLSEVTIALLNFDGMKSEPNNESSSLNQVTQSKGQRIPHLPDAIRKDGINHFPVQKDKPTRCAVCKTNAVVMCEKCNVTLHIKCFKTYHI